MEMICSCITYIKGVCGFLIVLFCMGCEYESAKPDSAPVIYISKIVDTAYLNTFYNSETVEVEPCEGVTVTGKVNTSKLGTYYLDHDYTDKFGNKSATVTRTVHVLENSASFLNGTYSAVCSCTTLGNNGALESKDNYTASVSSSRLKDQFELVNLKIGKDYIIPMTSLKGNVIKVDYFWGGNIGTGTLSSARTVFTIESSVNGDSPIIEYKCKNIFTKIDPEEEKGVLKQ